MLDRLAGVALVGGLICWAAWMVTGDDAWEWPVRVAAGTFALVCLMLAGRTSLGPGSKRRR